MELNQYRVKGRQVPESVLVKYTGIESNKVQSAGIKKRRAAQKLKKQNEPAQKAQRRAGNTKSSRALMHLSIAERRSDIHSVQSQSRI